MLRTSRAGFINDKCVNESKPKTWRKCQSWTKQRCLVRRDIMRRKSDEKAHVLALIVQPPYYYHHTFFSQIYQCLNNDRWNNNQLMMKLYRTERSLTLLGVPHDILGHLETFLSENDLLSLGVSCKSFTMVPFSEIRLLYQHFSGMMEGAMQIWLNFVTFLGSYTFTNRVLFDRFVLRNLSDEQVRKIKEIGEQLQVSTPAVQESGISHINVKTDKNVKKIRKKTEYLLPDDVWQYISRIPDWRTFLRLCHLNMYFYDIIYVDNNLRYCEAFSTFTLTSTQIEAYEYSSSSCWLLNGVKHLKLDPEGKAVFPRGFPPINPSNISIYESPHCRLMGNYGMYANIRAVVILSKHLTNENIVDWQLMCSYMSNLLYVTIKKCTENAVPIIANCYVLIYEDSILSPSSLNEISKCKQIKTVVLDSCFIEYRYECLLTNFEISINTDNNKTLIVDSPVDFLCLYIIKKFAREFAACIKKMYLHFNMDTLIPTGCNFIVDVATLDAFKNVKELYILSYQGYADPKEWQEQTKEGYGEVDAIGLIQATFLNYWNQIQDKGKVKQFKIGYRCHHSCTVCSSHKAFKALVIDINSFMDQSKCALKFTRFYSIAYHSKHSAINNVSCEEYKQLFNQMKDQWRNIQL